jgi:hypothetical protein
MTLIELVAAAVGTVAAVAMVVAIWTVDFGQ